MSGFSQGSHRSRASRAALSGVLVCLAGSSLAVVGTASSATAATAYSTYALSSHGFTSQVDSGVLSLRSAPTAYSVLGCSRKTGYTRTNNLAQADNGEAKIDAARTVQQSYKNSGHYTVLSSTSTAAAATFGSSTFGIKITGLRNVAKVYATRTGRLHASSTFTFADIKAVGPTPLPAALNQPASVILKQLAANGPVLIPGIGTLKLGAQGAATNSTTARAAGTGLQVHLFGADQVNGTADDSDVTLVRSYAQLSKAATNGLFSGAAWGLDASAVGGIAAAGQNPYTPLGCLGTKGEVVTRSLVGLDLASSNQVAANGLRNRVYGRQNAPSGGLTGWTESAIADVDVAGGLHVEGIRARAKAVRSRSGRVSQASTQVIGSITVNGTPHAVPSPGQSFTIPNLATVAVPKPVKTSNGIRVTALRVTLLSGSAAQSVINLGNATVSVRLH